MNRGLLTFTNANANAGNHEHKHKHTQAGTCYAQTLAQSSTDDIARKHTFTQEHAERIDTSAQSHGCEHADARASTNTPHSCLALAGTPQRASTGVAKNPVHGRRS
eukprot:10859189-Alexandrium_andersonii.AAC.1